jgi:hypothetical protein
MKLELSHEEAKVALAELEGKQEALCQGLCPPSPDAVFALRRTKYRVIEKLRAKLRHVGH